MLARAEWATYKSVINITSSRSIERERKGGKEEIGEAIANKTALTTYYTQILLHFMVKGLYSCACDYPTLPLAHIVLLVVSYGIQKLSVILVYVANVITGAIVGGVVGGLLPLGIALILIFLVILLLLRKKSEQCMLLMNAHTILFTVGLKL